VKLLVLGAGGIGGYFGGRLAETGADVTFLVRPRRRDQLERDGLRVKSPLGDLRTKVKTVEAAALKPGYDFVLLTCKAYDLDSALDAIAPAMDGTCAVVPMLNGMAHLDALDKRFGKESVMGGTCAIGVHLASDGVIHHADSLQKITFGDRTPGKSRATMLADAFGRTKVDWSLSEDVEQSMWDKIVFLSVLAATNCLFRANIGELLSAPGGPEAMERALATNIEIAAREGHRLSPAAIGFARKTLLDPTSKRAGSMVTDLEAGGRVEADHIVGWMLGKAREHRQDDTILALAYTHLKAYEARRAAGRLPHS
jgi:2-dehydropantoate 2-reductase